MEYERCIQPAEDCFRMPQSVRETRVNAQDSEFHPAKWTAVGLALLVLASCAPNAKLPTISEEEAAREALIQREIAGDLFRKRRLRVHTVHWNLVAANVDMCNEAEFRIGALMLDAGAFEPSWHEWTIAAAQRASDAAEFYRADDRIRVLEVIPGSPAERSGMVVGDIVTQFGNKVIANGRTGRDTLLAQLEDMSRHEVLIGLNRDGRELSVRVVPQLVCRMPVVLAEMDEINAFADGERVYVTSGMLRFAEDNDELALVLAHEMAHNTRGHVEAQQTNILLGTLIGAVVDGLAGGYDTTMMDLGQRVGATAYSQEFEREADYVGVYIAGRAGYDISGAAFLWRRLAAEHPDAIHFAGGTHPSTPVRFQLVQKASDEFLAKQRRGLPLVPEEQQPN